jgi:phenylalanyl-tRNA synthetase alpha chain
MTDISELKKRARAEIARAGDAAALEVVRVTYVGRKGELTELLRTLKDIPLEERRTVGPKANALKNELEALLAERKSELEREVSLAKNHLDVTKPGHRPARGRQHPLSRIDQEVRRIFTSLNFSVVRGPEAESAYYNFDALNIPENHPARDMWDTFWLQLPAGGGKFARPNLRSKSGIGKANNTQFLLRTHTSPAQIHYMETHEPPFQIIVPGRVFRYEATDASHEVNFYQVEGLMVGPDVSLANFKYIIERFFEQLFEKKVEFRFRPSYFPFVEPGLEVDIKIAGGRWLEVMGAGMVHRNVFDAVRYNPDTVQGFAFGVGLDRLAMIKYGVPDIRLFYSGDARFTRQF